MIRKNVSAAPSNMARLCHEISSRPALTCHPLASQTSVMAQTYFLFDFGPDEEKVQQARHKLESWKQAFRLDKKLHHTLEPHPPSEPGDAKAKETPAAKTEKSKSGKAKSQSKPKSKDSAA